jgi:hypothetical protein
VTKGSLEIATAELKRFLLSPEPEVLCITGEWGVGKTFTWDKVLNESSASESIALKRYAYVSLFGETSLESLKQSIFENTEFLVNEEEEFRKQAKAFGNVALQGIKKGRSLLAALPYVGASLEKALSASNAVFFSTIRTQIVCIDDLERRGTGLRLKDVLGLVSFLREQRSCKIVLLLNDKQLETEEVDFVTKTEKVIDTFIRFSPSADESAKIALTEDDEITKSVAVRCIQLNISNIRIIRKIHRLAKIGFSSVKEWNAPSKEQFIQSVVLFAWIRFDPKNAPNVQFLRQPQYRLFVQKDAKPLSEEESRWKKTLRDYNFGDLDAFDEEIQKAIDNGFFDASKMQHFVDTKQEEIKRGKGDRDLAEAWNLLRNTFSDNSTQIADAMQSAINNNNNISLQNIDAVVVMLKSIGFEDRAAEVITGVAERETPSDFWKPEKYSLFGEIKDEDLKAVVLAKNQEGKKEASLEETLIRIGERNGWRDEDIERVVAADQNLIVSLLREAEGQRFKSILNGLLTFMPISNASNQMQAINSKAEAVLKIIGEDSPLNAFRVRGYLRGG